MREKSNQASDLEQKTLSIRRVTRVGKGGRRFSFSVALAAGDRRGGVGVGVGKAADISLAMDKALKSARKNMLRLKLTERSSLPYDVEAKFASSRVRLAPAPGRGLVAGSSARIVLDLAGVRDASAKFFSKSKNKLNNARATMRALELICNYTN